MAIIIHGKHATIRPALHSLQRMPTIHQVAESWGRLELKLETDDTRYWVTTEGVPHKMSGTPIKGIGVWWGANESKRPCHRSLTVTSGGV